MIISCTQCDKKFEIESNLIPKEGRLLQCSSCNHKWFYKKRTEKIATDNLKKQIFENKKIKKPIKKQKTLYEYSKEYKTITSTVRKKKEKITTLNIILVFIITIITLVLILDTFKNPISTLIPNINFLLESLNETLKDIILFIKDLL
tara:strand:- start:441 stop:881 length:441 start_codon:yes stop_codon:yes gene_type:complete